MDPAAGDRHSGPPPRRGQRRFSLWVLTFRWLWGKLGVVVSGGTIKMNKNEIAQLMVKDSSIIKSNAIKVIDTLVTVIGDQLKKKQGKVTLVGFGTFKVIEKKAKVGRNPKTGARINIPKKRVPKFISGKELKALVR
jgi:DNA-binding protein HU-beta